MAWFRSIAYEFKMKGELIENKMAFNLLPNSN